MNHCIYYEALNTSFEKNIFHMSYIYRVLGFHDSCQCEALDNSCEKNLFHMSYIYRVLGFDESFQCEALDNSCELPSYIE